MTTRANILLIMTDQLRCDHVGCLGAEYGGARVATPNIDRIAAGAAFTTCVSVNPVCMPARSAMLTGRYSHQIGALAMAGDLDPSIPTYPRALQAAGYHTAAIGKLHYLQGWPWDTPPGQGHDLVALHERLRAYGFDHLWEASGKQLVARNYCDWAAALDAKGLLPAVRDWAENAGANRLDVADGLEFRGEPWPFGEEDYVDVATTTQALRWLRERPQDQPFCGLVSLCGPHPPFDPPPRFLDAEPMTREDDFVPGPEPLTAAQKERLWTLRRAYRAMVRCIDEQVGRLLSELEAQGILDDTVILFTSDHGEMLGDHGRMQKQSHCRQSLLVPTAIRHPDHLLGRRISAPVELTDLTATILDCAGLDAQVALSEAWPAYRDRIPCRSLLPLLRGDVEGVRPAAFSESQAGWDALISSEWKYVRHRAPADDPQGAREELYDRRQDPDERCDVLAVDGAVAAAAAAARDQLRAYRSWVHDCTPSV
ncbi:MAG: sulfatase family protein, partial [Planctomycetota bacterium]